MVTYATQSTKRYQWEDNSKYSQSWNCGPTCATFIASFYKSVYYGIEATRKLVAPPQTATSVTQQRDMLVKRGVPASVVQIDSLAELHSLVDSGRRPVILGIEMSRVPSSYRDHTFIGWHAVVVMSGATNNGVRGFWINDPNFSPPGGIRPDPDRGMKWYPDWVIQSAVINNTQRWAVVPSAAKPLPTTAPSTEKGRGHVKTPPAGNVINIRTSMSTTTAANIYARAMPDGKTYRRSDGKYLWSNASNYIFLGWAGTNGSWAKVKTGSGMILYISRPLFTVTVWP
ncbi:MAG TPA: hypothetical protein VN756_08755 [Solirubrobacterales bacterium]|nr:hypothetical protein [Solirubrobacterales bacterium]